MTSKLEEIFGSSVHSLAIKERVKVLKSVLNITIPIIIAFSVLNFAYHFYAIAVLQAISLLLVVPAWYMTRHASFVALAEFLALFATATILLFIIYDGGIAGLGYVWGWAFPFIAFYIAGIRHGWYWCMGFILVAGVIFMFSLGAAASYDNDSKVVFFVCYLFYLIISYWFNAIRFKYLFGLEEKVHKRTAQLEHISLYDRLTDLPNRLHVTNYIQNLISEKKENFAVLNLDINRFSEINNVLGYDNGDQLLKAFAERLRSIADGHLFAGRMSSDEFVVVLHDLSSSNTLESFREITLEKTRRLQGLMEQPYDIDHIMIELEVTIGYELPDPQDGNASHMIRRANFACHMAKKMKNKVAVYDLDQDANSARQIHIFTGLRRALLNHELKLFFQPKVDMHQGRVTGVEALIRWHSVEEGHVSPNQFIPVAESTGLIHAITDYALDEAMRQQALWIEQKYHINIAINLSARSLLEPDLIAVMRSHLEKHGVSPADFTLEITESAFMRQPEKALQRIHELKAMGFLFSLDDYGTGYTSLSYLKDMPVDEVKIDQSFITNCLNSDKDSAIVESTIDLVGKLGLQVVAEGIESKEIWDKLEEMGCDKGQGYFLAHPMPAEKIIQWLEESDWTHN